MPKTIIEFNQEEEHELEMCQNGLRYHCALWEFKQYLRNELKYGTYSEEQLKIIEEIQDNFFEILTDNKAHLE